MAARESLIDALAKIAKSQWETKGQPVFLSNLPPLLAVDAPDYKEFLAGKSLKEFIKETETAENSHYKLVAHPRQSAKLGLAPLPEGKDFQYPDTFTTPEQATNNDRSSEKALIDFLKALKKLPPQDLVEVKIPVSILVKMIK